MNYQRYFKNGQQLLLRVQNDVKQDGRTELMTAFVDSSEEGFLILSLPYGADSVDQYPFRPELPFEVTSEALGLGVRAAASFV